MECPSPLAGPVRGLYGVPASPSRAALVSSVSFHFTGTSPFSRRSAMHGLGYSLAMGKGEFRLSFSRSSLTIPRAFGMRCPCSRRRLLLVSLRTGSAPLWIRPPGSLPRAPGFPTCAVCPSFSSGTWLLPSVTASLCTAALVGPGLVASGATAGSPLACPTSLLASLSRGGCHPVRLLPPNRPSLHLCAHRGPGH